MLATIREPLQRVFCKPRFQAGLFGRPRSGVRPLVAEECFESGPRLGPARGADAGGVIGFEFEHSLAGDVEPGEPAVGVADDHAAAVGWVGVAADDSEPLELVDDLGDRLACDVGVGGELARTSAALPEV